MPDDFLKQAKGLLGVLRIMLLYVREVEFASDMSPQLNPNTDIYKVTKSRGFFNCPFW
jgi:hypothetical protein